MLYSFYNSFNNGYCKCNRQRCRHCKSCGQKHLSRIRRGYLLTLNLPILLVCPFGHGTSPKLPCFPLLQGSLTLPHRLSMHKFLLFSLSSFSLSSSSNSSSRSSLSSSPSSRSSSRPRSSCFFRCCFSSSFSFSCFSSSFCSCFSSSFSRSFSCFFLRSFLSSFLLC